MVKSGWITTILGILVILVSTTLAWNVSIDYIIPYFLVIVVGGIITSVGVVILIINRLKRK